MDLFGVLTLIGGLALFLYGMNIMGDGLVMLSGGKLEKILERLTEKRIFALLLGVFVTAVIQSSSATTVMVVGFVNSGIMKLTQAVGVIMGANIGTILFMVVFYVINRVFPFAFLDAKANAAGIAVIHSLFNIGCAIVMFPFANGLLRLASMTIKEVPENFVEPVEPAALVALDERFLDRPAFAIQLCKNAVDDMAAKTKDALFLAMDNLSAYSEWNIQEVVRLEQIVDYFEDDLVMEMKQRHIARLRSGICFMEAGLLLEDILTNYERVSDHCSNVAVTLIEIQYDAFDRHEYLDVKIKENDTHFKEEYLRLKRIYILPGERRSRNGIDIHRRGRCKHT